MSWPMLKRTIEMARLKSAAEQIQTAFGHARIDAMNKGQPQVFHFEPGTGQYCVEVWQDPLVSTEGDASTSAASTSTTLGGAVPAGAASPGGAGSSA